MSFPGHFDECCELAFVKGIEQLLMIEMEEGICRLGSHVSLGLRGKGSKEPRQQNELASRC